MRPAIVVLIGLAALGCQPAPPSPEEFLGMAAKGQTAKVISAVKAGSRVNTRDRNGFSALSSAASNGHLETVKALLKLGARTDRGPGLFRPLAQAAYAGHLEIVNLLIEHGALVEYPHREEQPIAMATKPQIIRRLVEAGANVDRPAGSAYDTALHRAAAQGEVKAVQTLLELGASVNTPSMSGATPLHQALRAPGIELRAEGVARARRVIALLLASKADPNIADLNQNTPMHIAARVRWIEPADLEALLRAGGRLDQKNSLERTPLDVAKANGFQKDAARLDVLTPRSGKE